MLPISTRLRQIIRSPRAALGIFASLVLGTAALLVTSQATGGAGEGTAPPEGPPLHRVRTNGTDGVTFSAALSQSKLVQGSNGVIYLDLRIATPEARPATAEVRATDLVVVLDRSGSMAAENRLPYAKEAVRSLLSRLRTEDRFALVTFDSTAVVNAELTPVTEAMRVQMGQHVHSLQPGSSTNISAGLLKARALFRGPAGARSRKVILLSDGEANRGLVDPQALATIAASFAAQHAVLSTIGMGLGFNETLMASLADHGMGHYGYLEHLSGLGDILVKDMQEARQVYASASGLDITLGEGVTVADAGGYPLDGTSKPGTVRVVTGQLLGGTSKHFVVTLMIPTQHPGNFGLEEMTLHYDTGDGTRRVSLAGGQLRVAVLEPARRDEAVASVDQGLFRQLWEGNNLGRLQKAYSHWVRTGDKARAEQTIRDYRQSMQTAESDTGVPVASQGVIDQLSAMEQELKEAFTGPAGAQQEKRNRAAKSRHDTALKSQRSQ